MLELSSTSLTNKISWAQIEYFGIATLPTFWLLFIIQFTQRTKWLTRRNVVLLFAIPIITIVLVWTNDSHHLIWSAIRLLDAGDFTVLDTTKGIGFWIHTVYAYLQLLTGSVLLLANLVNFPELLSWKSIYFAACGDNSLGWQCHLLDRNNSDN